MFPLMEKVKGNRHHTVREEARERRNQFPWEQAWAFTHSVKMAPSHEGSIPVTQTPLTRPHLQQWGVKFQHEIWRGQIFKQYHIICQSHLPGGTDVRRGLYKGMRTQRQDLWGPPGGWQSRHRSTLSRGYDVISPKLTLLLIVTKSLCFPIPGVCRPPLF